MYPRPVPKNSPPCADGYGMMTYLNRSDVRKALHVPDSAPEWGLCSALDYRSIYRDMSQQYKALIAKNVCMVLGLMAHKCLGPFQIFKNG